MQISQMKTMLVFAQLCLLLGTHWSQAEDSYVTLWANGFGTTNEVSAATLELKTNQIAHLVSWPQMEFRPSFLSIKKSVMSSFSIRRKPEVEINYKTKQAKEIGPLPLPDIVVAGPAFVELSVVGAETIFCTFRVVDGKSNIIESPRNGTGGLKP